MRGRHTRVSMNTQILSIVCGVIIGSPLHAQVSIMFPPAARDSLEASDRRSPTAARDRQRNLDSLAAGRRRWARGAVTEYRIQTHVDCFCMYTREELDSLRQRSLLTVRAGAIVGHSPGGPRVAAAKEWTVDSLFAFVERDLTDPGRVVRRLQLDPQYGFPKDYRAETPPIPDAWVGIKVDSFAVVSQHRAAVTHR